LIEKGFEVSIVALVRFDAYKLRQLLSIDLSNAKIFTLFSKTLPFLGLYQRLEFFIPLSKAVKKLRPDLVFVDCELYKPVARLRSRLGFKIFEYIHFPYHRSFEGRSDLLSEYAETLSNYFRGAEERYSRGL